MSARRPSPLAAAFGALVALAPVAAQAQVRQIAACQTVNPLNLVANCGFEDPSVAGNPTGWLNGATPAATLGGQSGQSGAATGGTPAGPAGAHSGTHAPDFYYYGANEGFGAGQTYGAISQLLPLATLPGQTYTISFWAYNYVPPAAPTDPVVANANEFRVLFGGVSVFDQALPVGDAYQLYSVTVTAPTTPATFELDGYSNSGYVYFDDISVTAAPEPATWALLGAGLVGVGAAARRRRGARA